MDKILDYGSSAWGSSPHRRVFKSNLQLWFILYLHNNNKNVDNNL